VPCCGVAALLVREVTEGYFLKAEFVSLGGSALLGGILFVSRFRTPGVTHLLWGVWWTLCITFSAAVPVS
jgi:hypothetical protein